MTLYLQSYVSVAGVFVMILIALYQRRNNTTDKVWNKFDTKVDKDDCVNFRTRIGKESDDHREHIAEIKNDITEIKQGVAYLKGKYNG